jgi:hypothetical protein
MRVYVGQTRGRRESEMTALGFGEMTQPSEWPPRRTAIAWAQDNEVFAYWKAGRPFDDGRYREHIAEVHRAVARGWWEVSRGGSVLREPATPPAFLVVPDVVADGAASMRQSLRWLAQLEAFGWPLYFVVQDGMTAADVVPLMPDVDGLFVGGSSRWKWATAPAWGALCLDWGRPLHIGRVGTGKRARWAREIEVSLPGLALSVDSCIPLWSEGNMRNFCGGLETEPERQLVPRHVEAAPLIGYSARAPGCGVCGIRVVRPPLCPGCSLAWSTSNAPCSQEGFEAWSTVERLSLGGAPHER